MTNEQVEAAKESSAENAQWDMLKKMPPIARLGLVSLAYNTIENKFDGRTLTALAAAIIAGVAGVGWFTELGASAIRAASQCENLVSGVSRTPIAISVALSCVILLHLARLWRRRRRLLRADQLSDFKVVQRVLLCHVKSQREIDYYYRFVLKARKNDVRGFKIRFRWTGVRETFDVRMNNPRFSWSIPDDTDYRDGEIEISFKTPLSKGSEEVVEYCFSTKTPAGGEASPFWSLSFSSSNYPRFNTILSIWFSEDAKIASIYRQKYFPISSRVAIKSKVVTLDSERSHHWRLRPKEGWKFAIRWVYA